MYYDEYDYIDYDNDTTNSNDDYFEEDVVDFKLLEALGWATDKITEYLKKKAIKYTLQSIVPANSTIVIYNNDTKLELMCRPVDNTAMSYEEFCKNNIHRKIQFEIDIDHVINQNTTAGKIEALLKDIFEL